MCDVILIFLKFTGTSFLNKTKGPLVKGGCHPAGARRATRVTGGFKKTNVQIKPRQNGGSKPPPYTIKYDSFKPNANGSSKAMLALLCADAYRRKNDIRSIFIEREGKPLPYNQNGGRFVKPVGRGLAPAVLVKFDRSPSFKSFVQSYYLTDKLRIKKPPC